jgi:hypothetical protein
MVLTEFHDAQGMLLLEFLVNADHYCTTVQHLK